MTAGLEKMENRTQCLGPGSTERDFFLDLPEDVRRLLLSSYTGPQWIANLRACSSTHRALCNNADLWKDLCCKELRLKPHQLELPQSYTAQDGEDSEDSEGAMQIGVWKLEAGPVLSYWQLYSHLLHPFRGLLHKLLVASTSTYGEILTLTYVKGRIVGEVWWLPKNFTDKMKPLLDFVVCLDRDGTPVVVHGFAEGGFSKMSLPENLLGKSVHRGARGPFERDIGWVFAFRWPRAAPKEIDPGPWKRLREQIKNNGIARPKIGSKLARDQFHAFLTGAEFTAFGACTHSICFRHPYQYHVQTISAPVVFSCGLALPLGFFKGTYGEHGNQLIKVEYVEDTRYIRGIKMTGDCDVPAGKTTFQFSIDCAVFFSLEQQQNLASLEALHHTGPFHALDRLSDINQPFCLPTGLSSHPAVDDDLVKGSCQFRLSGHTTTAQLGFVSSKSHIANLIVFSPEKFVVVSVGGSTCAALFLKVADDDLFSTYYDVSV